MYSTESKDEQWTTNWKGHGRKWLWCNLRCWGSPQKLSVRISDQQLMLLPWNIPNRKQECCHHSTVSCAWSWPALRVCSIGWHISEYQVMQCCMLGSYSSVLGCDIVCLGEYFPTFWVDVWKYTMRDHHIPDDSVMKCVTIR